MKKLAHSADPYVELSLIDEEDGVWCPSSVSEGEEVARTSTQVNQIVMRLPLFMVVRETATKIYI